jgi:hypothetical protein
MADSNALLRAAIFHESHLQHWLNLFDEEDQDLARDFRLLMIKLYRYQRQDRPMYKMDACRFIPVKHSASAKKYIDRAEERGLISFEPDPKDKRKVLVRPSPALIELVEEHLLRLVEQRPDIAAVPVAALSSAAGDLV